MEPAGLITRLSRQDSTETARRLRAAIARAGMIIFAEVDHAAGAHEVGAELRPTLLLLFGHPRGGTPLMLVNQTAGLDLPLKALIWEDEDGDAWLSYNDPQWIAARHGAGAAASAVAALATGMDNLATAATT
jgi:uncharacterized protein (DUF302 family)